MIRAVVLDIDGVILGDKKGFNFPHPSKKVREAIRKIHDSGIPVSLLSAKPAFTAYENIKSLGIDNPHIAAGGGVIFNPMRDEIINIIAIKPHDVLYLLKVLPKNVYVNFFGINEYYLQKNQVSKFTDLYADFAGRSPILIDDFKKIINKEPIMKINIAVFSKKEKEEISKIMKFLSNKFSFKWGLTPYLAPTQIMNVSAKGISKRSGIEYLAKYLKISLDEILGVGDEMFDWDFLEVCGYKAAMGNASDELKEKINVKDRHQMIAGHVNDDGILDVFKYFGLI